MSVCLVAIFKNEGHIFKEWITHYLNQGVDKFYLIDNGSNDNYQDKIQNYIDNNIVEIVVDAKKHSQTELYNKYFLTKCKNYDWVIVCDLDEFIYARKGFSTIKQYLNSLHYSIGQVFVPWKIFGSNGHINQDYESVTQTFTKREKYISEVLKNTKCIVRTIYLINFVIHGHKIINFNKIRNITTNHIPNNIIDNSSAKISEQILEDSFLHLNHYVLQSYDWFMNIKATRGDVYQSGDYIRNETYFRDYDKVSNDIEDYELSNIIKNYVS
jgi:hypothetical protein